MSSVESLGLIAGALIACSMIPQLIRVFKLKSTKEISILFAILFILGATCWIVYGLLLQLVSVVLWNSIMIALFTTLLYAKLKYGR